ncbi:hypothetical protein [Georgenia sp. SUBG003]|uniref:hypothetical protein n=1 Tax=Georgenia sp. SUBG003 TaxID=1497974 RepID=UPI003AB14F03
MAAADPGGQAHRGRGVPGGDPAGGRASDHHGRGDLAGLGAQLSQLLFPQFDGDADRQLLTRAMAASPGAAVGEIVMDNAQALERSNAGANVILVRRETNPDDLQGMMVAAGVLTAEPATPAPTAAESPASTEPAAPAEELAESAAFLKVNFTFTDKDGYTYLVDGPVTILRTYSDTFTAPPGQMNVRFEFAPSFTVTNTTPGRQAPLPTVGFAPLWDADSLVCQHLPFPPACRGRHLQDPRGLRRQQHQR